MSQQNNIPRPGLNRGTRKTRPEAVRITTDQIRRDGSGYINREKFDALTDEDIARQIAADPDVAPEMTDDDLKRARVVRPYRAPEKAE